MDKRDFLRTLGAGSLGIALSPALLAHLQAATPEALAQDDPFWAQLRGRYTLVPEYINLESGYFSMQSQPVLEAFVGHVRRINRDAQRYMRTVMVTDKARVQRRLAGIAGCGVDELIITRNTTESLDTVISGFDWKPGDHAVMASCDYGAMIDHFAQQARRYNMHNTIVNLPLHPATDDEIVDMYSRAITERTRLLMVCHIVNITGQVLPVQKIAAMAQARGVQVLVDGAHAFAQMDFKVPDLGVDYYGASLHKWLGTPIGAGMLYVRKDRVAELWPMYGDPGFAQDDIRKLNHTGTHPCHTDLGIEDAVLFHEQIGVQRKQARLKYLQEYWTKQVRGQPKIVMNTPEDPARTCAIANVGIEGIAPGELAKRLFDEHKIFTVAINRPEAGVAGVRVTPHLYTTTGELDSLVRALKTIAT